MVVQYKHTHTTCKAQEKIIKKQMDEYLQKERLPQWETETGSGAGGQALQISWTSVTTLV